MSEFYERYCEAVKNRTQLSPAERFLGFFPVAVEPGFIAFELNVTEQHANPQGTLMGGITSALADMATGVAFSTTLEADETFTTIELKINYLKPVWSGVIRAEGRVIKRGRTIGLVECSIYDESRSLVAHATSTCMALRGDKAEGR
ncbi:PaaI family thioesterase [Paenibacillus sp. GCM10027626]|uniref:PaaI family thioesterase n=1 Tax=Paenibacillus sp. GCM10027626 TaxID=3273411 RepID=UPI00362589AF